MATQPADLVSFGKSFRLRDETLTLTATPGPAIALRWGTLAVADPWWPEMLPESQVIAIAEGEQAHAAGRYIESKAKFQAALDAASNVKGQIEQAKAMKAGRKAS